MLNIFFGENETTGFISIACYEALTTSLKEELESTVLTHTKHEDYLSYVFKDSDSALAVADKIKKLEKSQNRAESRRNLELILSGGLYEKSDIADIYEAQEGKCYYTGENLSLEDKIFSIDHIIPVCNGGSSWPGNLVLTLVYANQEKLGMSKDRFLKTLEERYGREWAVERKSIRKQIDVKRRKIDKKRKEFVYSAIKGVENELISMFPYYYVTYVLKDDSLVLSVCDVDINFPRGFLRKRKKATSVTYLAAILTSVIAT